MKKHLQHLSLTLLIGYLIFCSFSLSDMAPRVVIHKQDPVHTNAKDVDVMAFLDKAGIKVRVDEEALVEKYGLVDLEVADKSINMSFPNPKEDNYTLDIYDLQGNPIISLIDIYDDEVSVETMYLQSTEYLYKLRGNGNLYAGKFRVE